MGRKTFKEWSDDGYLIIKGSKSVGRNENNDCLFDSSQVKLREATVRHTTFVEDCSDRARAKGTPFGVVEDFDSFVREASMLPGNSRHVRYAVIDPLEQYFMEVAWKHDIIDGVLDGEFDDYY